MRITNHTQRENLWSRWLWYAFIAEIVLVCWCAVAVGEGWRGGRDACQQPHPAVVMVRTPGEYQSQPASGVLVDHEGQLAADEALVLTAAHVVDGKDGQGEWLILFPDGKGHHGVLLGSDLESDVAAFKISRPATEPVRLADTLPRLGSLLVAMGYGDECFQRRPGVLRSYVWIDVYNPEGPQRHAPGESNGLDWSGGSRDGDSGGPVFDQHGDVVGLVSGTDRATSSGPSCVSIRRFLRRIFIRRRQGESPPGATPEQYEPAPETHEEPPASQPPADGLAPVPFPVPMLLADELLDLTEQLDAITARLDEAEAIDPPESPDLSGINTRLDSLAVRLDEAEVVEVWAPEPAEPPGLSALSGTIQAGIVRKLMPFVFGALGLSATPPVGLGAWLLVRAIAGRRKRRKARQAADIEAMAAVPAGAPDVSGDVFQRDLTEAKQILQLSRLEGRSPLCDAIVGRFAQDELANLVEANAGQPQGDWAQQLLRKLTARFNQVAPLATHAQAQGV